MNAPQHPEPPKHGGGIDAAVSRWGGERQDWLDLSTGINPLPYRLPQLPGEVWTELPDQVAADDLDHAARRFWEVPDGASIIAAPGSSALIARIPGVTPPGRVRINEPTYNEHRSSFTTHGWEVIEDGPAEAQVAVHPNNPTGAYWEPTAAPLTVIDETFCDVTPEATLMGRATRPGTLILKSIGKFWGLPGLRLGFAMGDPDLIADLAKLLGPWPVSGPALHVGAAVLSDFPWAVKTRKLLAASAEQLDALMEPHTASVLGTALFRLYEIEDAMELHERLARRHILTRVFPWSTNYIRIGLPGSKSDWRRLEEALV